MVTELRSITPRADIVRFDGFSFARLVANCGRRTAFVYSVCGLRARQSNAIVVENGKLSQRCRMGKLWHGKA